MSDDTIAPILKLMGPLNRQIERATKDVEKIAHQDPTVRRLCTAPGVGSITAASFMAPPTHPNHPLAPAGLSLPPERGQKTEEPR